MHLNRILAGRLTTPDPDDRKEHVGHYRMFVRDLVLECSIGIHDFEKTKRQRVRISADLLVRETSVAADDDIRNVMSYEGVINGIKAICDAGHINLVETLAQAVADMCLGDRRVARVVVKVEKLDIEPNAAGVGVEIVRQQKTPWRENVHPLYSFQPPRPVDGGR